MYQTTIHKAFSCSGVGLHSGNRVRVTVRPASEHTGIVFEVCTSAGIRRLSPRPEAVVATGLATTLDCNGTTVSTVEHLLATVRGLGIDNVIIGVEGGEVPILDGSAAEWTRLFDQAGIMRQQAARRVLRVSRPVEVRDGNKYIRAVPHDGFRVDCVIDFAHPSIGRQHMALDITPGTFGQVARARTFGFLQEVEYLRSKGLARGGSLDNAVVLNDSGVVNEGGLRFENEFVRHKVLDFVGDMAMLPLPLQGSFETSCSGHELNNRFLRRLEAEGALQVVELSSVARPVRVLAPRAGTWVAA